MKHDQLSKDELAAKIVEIVDNDGCTLAQLMRAWRAINPGILVERLDEDTVIVSTPADEGESS